MWRYTTERDETENGQIPHPGYKILWKIGLCGFLAVTFRLFC